MNYVLKDDQPPVPFRINVGEVKDAEGQVIENPQLSYDISSTDDNVLHIDIDDDGKSGKASFGSPGVANFNVQVKGPDDRVLGSGGDTFTLTTGDPNSVASVNTTFDGLTPVDQPPA